MRTRKITRRVAVIKNAIRIVTVIIVTALFFNPVKASGQFFFMENEDIGKEVRDFTLKVLNGEEVNLTKFRDGKRLIIFFWATWCPHCRVALGELNEKKEEIERKNIKIVLVDVGEKEQVVDQYMEKNKIDMDVFLDEDSKVAESYGLIGVPTFYFVNEQGIVENVKHSLPESPEDFFSKT